MFAGLPGQGKQYQRQRCGGCRDVFSRVTVVTGARADCFWHASIFKPALSSLDGRWPHTSFMRAPTSTVYAAPATAFTFRSTKRRAAYCLLKLTPHNTATSLTSFYSSTAQRGPSVPPIRPHNRDALINYFLQRYFTLFRHEEGRW